MCDRKRNAARIFIFVCLKVRYDSYEKFSLPYSWWNSLFRNILEVPVTIKGKKKEKRKSNGSSKNADKNTVS